MVVYNAASKELTAKIVYYGPGFGGKTTNLQFLHRRLEPSSVGNLLTLAATADRTIFFDLLPVELGDLKGYRIRFQVATVPGQSPYNETRRVVLRGADGVVFVVDSRWSQLPKNLESLQNLRQNLVEEGIDVATIPFAVQFNKRDLPDVLAVDALQEGLGLAGFPFIEAVASDGKGVVETFKLISKLTFVDILRRLQKRGTARTARPATTETENLSAWKSSMVRGTGPYAPEISSAPRRGVPEPIAFPEADDLGTTRAIPTLAKSHPAAASVSEATAQPIASSDAAAQPIAFSDAAAQPIAFSDGTAQPMAFSDADPTPVAIEEDAASPIAIAPFAIEEDEPAAVEPPPRKIRREDEIVFETSPPLAETAGVTEDTNPAFFARRPPSAPAPVEPPRAEDSARTAGFAVPDAFTDEPSPEPPAMAFPADEGAPSPETSPAEPPAPDAAVTAETARSSPEPASVASPLEARMIQLAVVSAWGDRISAAEEKLARWDALEDRLAGAERLISEGAGIPGRLGALEGRLGQVEGARSWAKDFDLLRTDWANARLASEGQLGDLRRAIADLQQSFAEGSGREMELVAQMSRGALGTTAALEKLGSQVQETEDKFRELVMQASREALGTAAALEKLGFRIQETEEKFSQLVVDQESRLARLERLVDEQSARTTADRESGQQAVLEMEERFRALRDEETENRRRIAADLDEARRARDDSARRQGSIDDLRRRLADSLADLARRFGDDPPS